MDKKTVIQINIEVPKIVGDVISEAEKYTRGVFELIRFGQRIIFKNQSTANEPKKELKKISIK